MSSSPTPYKVIDVSPELTPANSEPTPYRTSQPPPVVGKIEFNSFKASLSKRRIHGLVAAVHTAYAQHLPLHLKPDDIWTVIVQSLSQHINMDPEKHRKKLVDFEGKIDLVVRRDELKLGSTTESDWKGILAEFEKQIKDKAGKYVSENIVQKYSTTLPINTFVYQGVLMESVRAFFNYVVNTMCGIPRVVMHGTLEDWKKLHRDVINLNLTDFDKNLGQWDFDLRGITKNLVQSYQCDPSVIQTSKRKVFFETIYKYSYGSGGSHVSGWITKLFLYLKDSDGNWSTDMKYANTGAFPMGFTDVPFVWRFPDRELPMTICAGFDGANVETDETKDVSVYGVSTRYGFCIQHKVDGYSIDSDIRCAP